MFLTDIYHILCHNLLLGRFIADNLNKAKNLCSKTVGEKMKVHEPMIEVKDSNVFLRNFFIEVVKAFW